MLGQLYAKYPSNSGIREADLASQQSYLCVTDNLILKMYKHSFHNCSLMIVKASAFFTTVDTLIITLSVVLTRLKEGLGNANYIASRAPKKNQSLKIIYLISITSYKSNLKGGQSGDISNFQK